MASGIVAVAYWTTGPVYKVKTFDTDGNEIANFSIRSITSDNQWVTMDSLGNIYVIEDETDLLVKYNSSGVEQCQLSIQDSYAIDIDNDGYLYTLEVDPISGYDVVKRNTSDLSQVDTINFGAGKSYRGFAVEVVAGQVVLYLGEANADVIEKRSFASGNLLASRAVNSSVFAFSRQHLGLLGSTLYGAGGTAGWRGFYMPKALNEDATAWVNGQFPQTVTIYNEVDIYAAAWDGSNHSIKKYNSSRELQWTSTVISTGGVMAIGACSYVVISVVIPTITTAEITNILPNKSNGGGEVTDTGGEDCTKRGVCWNLTGSPTVEDNIVEEEGTFGVEAFTSVLTGLPSATIIYVKAYAYNSAGYGYGDEVSFLTLEDFVLCPVVFPVQLRRTKLKEKCINFENSMSDVCITLNHNIIVTREYLQAAYEGTDYDESSNLRDVLPSQQLVKLSDKDLTEENFKAIINNFITNISSMFTLINQNNKLVKAWLDDYEPDEEGHDFTDVKIRPIIIGKDLDRTMDELFESIEDNVTILNSNLGLLKERF